MFSRAASFNKPLNNWGRVQRHEPEGYAKYAYYRLGPGRDEPEQNSST